MRVGRNETCPCGSGKKFKACCEGKNSRGTSRGLIGLLVAIGVIGAAGVVASIRDKKEPTTTPPPAVARTSPRAQPPGPVPAGKVWSVEHGHWHNAAPPKGASTPPTGATPTPIQISPGARVPNTPKPQPPGPVPAGKVWSPEHGHWHDAR